MKQTLCLFIAVLGLNIVCCPKDLKVVDGPYVRYQGSQILVSVIEKDDDLLRVKTSAFSLNNKATILLAVTPEGHPEWGFSVKLKQAIQNDASSYPPSDKSLFISDIEGEFAPLRKMLLAAKVIDAQYNWTYGKSSLIIPGDLFDRGKDVVPELWLLYKLEDEAKSAGGSVQVILGNHDMMNMEGDHRYTDTKYFKNSWLLGTNCTGLFDKDTELGIWLRSKNIIEKTGDLLVMHGGVSPELLSKRQSAEQINTECRPFYDFNPKQVPDSLQLFFGRNSLFWYRGYFMGPKITMVELDSTLLFYRAKFIVVGHTIIKWNIASYLGGKVIGIDVDEHTGYTSAALYENGQWYLLNTNGHKSKLQYKAANDRIKDEDIL